MPKQNKQKNKNVKVKALTKQMKKVTVKDKPFRSVGGTLGGSIGSILGNATLGKNIGQWLGTGIGSIFGSGDYVAAGPATEYNVFAGQVPKFSSTRATNIVCHREYLGDVTGTTLFNNLSYPLNPGMSQTFPWLATIAAGYQQYRFHGLVFEFKSVITDFVTNGQPGVVVLATDYNSDLSPYINRVQAENSEFATSSKPTQSFVHMIECKSDEQAMKLYNVRSGPVGSNQDLRLYDLGLSQLITQGNPTGSPILGELWVTYCVEFFKPILQTVNTQTVSTGHVQRTGVNTNYLGNAQPIVSGNIPITVAAPGGGADQTISFPANIGYTYIVQYICTLSEGPVAATSFTPAIVSGAVSTSYGLLPNTTNSSGNYISVVTAYTATSTTVLIKLNPVFSFNTFTHTLDVFVSLTTPLLTA
jgi:hypothetical protein